MNKHRKQVYLTRQKILKSEEISDLIQEMIEEISEAYTPQDGDKRDDLVKEIKSIFRLNDEKHIKKLKAADNEKFVETIKSEAKDFYKKKLGAFPENIGKRLEREVYMQVLDNLWMQHLENMAHLREGITWQSVGQKDPLVEYRKQATDMFEALQAERNQEVIRNLMYAEPRVEAPSQQELETELTRAAELSESNSAQASKKREKRASKVDKKEATITRSQETTQEDTSKKRRDAKKKKKQKRKKGRR